MTMRQKVPDAPVASRLDNLVLELDLIVYALERPHPSDMTEAVRERGQLRRDLERARDALQEVVRSL